jgi:hypothetical protein
MRQNIRAAFIASTFFATAALLWPAPSRAQAEPGPIKSAPTSTDSPQPAAQPPAPKAPPQRKDITGSWKMNLDESDNPARKIQDARAARNSGSGGGNNGGGRGNGGGVWGGGGGYPGGGGGVGLPGGGGYPGGGGGGGGVYGRPRSRSSDDSDADYQTIQQALDSPDTLNFAQKDNEVDLTSSANDFQRTYYTDGRKLQKSTKDQPSNERSARWDDFRLVSEEKGPRGANVTRTFEAAPGAQQLIETVRYDGGGRQLSVSVRYVYDNAKQEKPAAPTTGTSSSDPN